VRTYDASATYSFDLGTTRDLSLGLLNMTSYGGGFNSLKFTVSSGAATLVTSSFTTLAAAQAYFTDHALDLGNFAAGRTSIKVDYALTASAAKGADVSYLLSSLPPVPGAAVRPNAGGPLVAGATGPARTGATASGRGFAGGPGRPGVGGGGSSSVVQRR
jgi:hypothetical protein